MSQEKTLLQSIKYGKTTQIIAEHLKEVIQKRYDHRRRQAPKQNKSIHVSILKICSHRKNGQIGNFNNF